MNVFTTKHNSNVFIAEIKFKPNSVIYQHIFSQNTVVESLQWQLFKDHVISGFHIFDDNIPFEIFNSIMIELVVGDRLELFKTPLILFLKYPIFSVPITIQKGTHVKINFMFSPIVSEVFLKFHLSGYFIENEIL